MMFACYDKYKSSDIDWFEAIPEHWEVKRLKDLGTLQNGISKGKEYFGIGFPFLSYSNVYNNKVLIEEIDGLANSSKGEQKLYSALEGDVFFTRTSETINEIGISATTLQTIRNATFSGFLIRLRPKHNLIIKNYSNFFFKAHINRLFLSREINIVTRASLSQSVLNNLPILLPPKTEQIAIAAFLEIRISSIDRKISLLEQKTTHYQQLRKTLINETVCRGLNKNVKLKDSGIECLGKIPEHWEVKRLKDIGYLYNGLSGKSGDDFNQDKSPKSKYYIPFTNIAKNQIINKEDLRLVLMGENELQNKVKKYDLFFLMSSENFEDLGKTAILADDLKDTYLNSFCKGFRIIKSEISPDFINYQLNAKAFKELLSIEGKGFTRINLKLEKVTDFKVILPPKFEQICISKFIDAKIQKIDFIINNIKAQIETLKELRKTMINDVVTGKIKVTNE